MSNLCFLCQVGILTIGITEYKIQVGNELFSIPIQSENCSECKEDYVKGIELRRAERLVASRILEDGFPLEGRIRFLRKQLGMKAVELAALLGIAPETLSRWEHGAEPDRLTWVTLLTLVREYLEGTAATKLLLQKLNNRYNS